ncbi:MAG: branched-chain amino acid ABC transporter permease LivH [Candidatus Lambdaproteobacteria bacterium RIFOXYD1_FULL_56_27]|uniref:Branched-chain amino acid ABC transporter permease LivH n=1 Tax=Candidatus Lambdaproteobacteria bacterium RIFOXYD2_FULL_56_26 TaxID=1817773 RepID=A0A1F6GSB9_9PROT|nr:MAG: branched-chain amino acid ABC transporter permease LivH [Candidatus Lambdaproteobacteria bacterium RIFOXYD2_FULL_56_26]OGH01348.1 MAG: branched-chain amino acid ABC transporter permease LivH [Candidatus Lambdaproteobacteria bacterium RIFOXYC1_FULL_56_13]OGH06889.1 MAG: branched-chain amino acid ABC transporter permease LivH [Candidatus Lambdaproteobacteria bacterium RIFOXYD1_FULL_56_27]
MNEGVAYFLGICFSGLTRGSIYALMALGYTLVYGILSLINFAHGEVYMIGAFVGLVFAGLGTILGLGPVANAALALGAAIVWAGAYGFILERVAYRPLRRAPRLAPLITAIGMSLFLREFVILAQTSDFVAFPPLFEALPSLPQGWGEFVLPSELLILCSTLAVLFGLYLLVQHSKMGLAMRSIAQDPEMARLLGIDVDKIISFTFVLGSALAAVGAVLISAQIGQINANIGFIVGIKAFTAAVLGGVGSPGGAALGGLVLGLTESLAAGYLSSDYEDGFAFLVLVLILLFRPAGLVGKNLPEKV